MAWATGRARAPALLLAATLGITFAIGCERNEPTAPARAVSKMPDRPNGVFGWDPGPSYNCFIGKQTSGWEGWLFPVVDSACGVRWTANSTQFETYSAMYFPYSPDSGWTLNTRWWLGSYNDIAAKDSVVTFTFDRYVQAFAMDLDGIDMPGHFMVAYNSDGRQLARVDFVANASHRDWEQIVNDSIYKVVYHLPLSEPCGTNFCYQADPVMHQVAFSYTPPPPPPLCQFVDSLGFPQDVEPLNDATFRSSLDSLLARSNIQDLYANRHEEIAFVRRNSDGTYRLDPTDFVRVHQCASEWTQQMLDAAKTDPTIVAIVHTHPFRVGDVPACPTAETFMYDPIGQHGGSSHDYRLKMTINYERGRRLIAPVPHYIIDVENVFYIPRGASQSSPDFQRMYRGQNLNCSWR